MIIDLYREREAQKAKKEYKENYKVICHNDNICEIIDTLIEEIEKSELESKEKYIKELKYTKIDIIAEMRIYEERNLEIMEIWEDEIYE